MPAAAMMPAWRMPPPRRLRQRRTSSTIGASPATTEPTGAPRPLLTHTDTVSHSSTRSAGLTPRATAALKSRAPSQWTRSPSECAARAAA